MTYSELEALLAANFPLYYPSADYPECADDSICMKDNRHYANRHARTLLLNIDSFDIDKLKSFLPSDVSMYNPDGIFLRVYIETGSLRDAYLVHLISAAWSP